ncbi:MAG: flagellar biosynthesis protein FliQ [Candidatus Eisenbacteria bacterium]|nr:flagellar biosynthesis protein FliQ [Candidatus Eisenbacteria bacterium]MCC7144697.1 flagellar biosynthesis protein FliQ [Candidatus Eisenbacteria bacterium]
MDKDFVLQVVRQGLLLTLVLSGPALLASLVIGLVVGVFQATTQIQEQTLSYVPKIIAVFAILALLGKWQLANLVKFSVSLLEQIPRVLAGFQ